MLVQGVFKHFHPNSFTLSLGAKIKIFCHAKLCDFELYIKHWFKLTLSRLWNTRLFFQMIIAIISGPIHSTQLAYIVSFHSNQVIIIIK